jgi:hypothetical protein
MALPLIVLNVQAIQVLSVLNPICSVPPVSHFVRSSLEAPWYLKLPLRVSETGLFHGPKVRGSITYQKHLSQYMGHTVALIVVLVRSRVKAASYLGVKGVPHRSCP